MLEARQRDESHHEQERAELLCELDLQRAACAEHKAHAEAATKELKTARSIHARELKEAHRLRDAAQRELAAEAQAPQCTELTSLPRLALLSGLI